MIKKIIGIADVHIPNYKGINEYCEHLDKLVQDLKKEIENDNPSEVRIVLLGDLIHNKNNISNELILLASNFISELEKLCKVIVIAGNHDLVLSNKSRLDTITTIFRVSNFENSIFLDEELDYKSGCLCDENIVWSLFSIYDNYNMSNLSLIKQDYQNNLLIGLFHGNLVGSTLSNGYASESGISMDIFNGCDIVLCGDIHKRQILKNNGIPIIYAGSLIQQNYGESVSQHGYVVVKIDENNNFNYNFIDFETDYGFYKFEISNKEDLDNDTERLINL